MDAVIVCLSELRERLASKDTRGELSHRVHGLGEALDECFDFIRDSSAVEELGLELFEFALRREFSGEKEPKSTFGDGLRTTGGLWTLESNLIKIFASIGDPIEVVKLGGLIEETGHASHTSDDLADGDLINLCVTVLVLELLEHLLLLSDNMFHPLLECAREVSSASLLNRERSR